MKSCKSAIILVGLAHLGFISIGLPDSLLGVAWPSIRAFFKLPLDALGSLLVMFTIGYLLASFSSGRILSRMNVGTLLALSCLATAVSLLMYALASSWWIMVTFGLFAGLGAGAIDAGISTFAATHFSARSVNWLHAFYGIGATAGPVIMTSVLDSGHAWQWGYAIVGFGQLVLAVCFALTRRLWTNEEREVGLARNASVIPTSPSARNTLRLPIMWLSIGMFFIYTGVEAAAGTWSYSLFSEGRAIPMITAGTWVSVYWGSLTAGRLLSGLVVKFAPIRLLLRFCMIGIAFGGMMIWLNLANLFSFIGLAAMGLFSAPIFPSLIASTPERMGEAHTANAVGFQIAAAVLGQSLLPSFIGVLAKNFDLEIVAPALLAAAVLLLVLYENLLQMSRRSAPALGGEIEFA